MVKTGNTFLDLKERKGKEARGRARNNTTRREEKR